MPKGFRRAKRARLALTELEAKVLAYITDGMDGEPTLRRDEAAAVMRIRSKLAVAMHHAGFGKIQGGGR